MAGLVLGGLAIWALSPRSMPGYLARQGVGQLTLLQARVSTDEVLARGALTAPQEERLRQIARIKAFGDRIGLNPIDNYEAVALGFDKKIWNVSACEPLAFRPRRWWFPVVGSVPYLGYFDETAAREEAARLEASGYEVYVRTAGAYSTLGWFRDPVLPAMLDWTEYRLAETLLHELTHATVWCPGQVQFNESLAQFTGREAALAYLADTYGPDSEPYVQALVKRQDSATLNQALHGLYEELDAVYKDKTLSPGARRFRKEALYAGLPARLEALPLERPDKARAWAEREPWNNARLAQFKVYNRGGDAFAAMFAEEGGDWGRFLARAEALCEADDPLGALGE
ncbi:MAG: aminopeptidase [Deltaproteobacteria bacterium]|nr:aminopeptidase [Deltaproteobacteria bacterium]